MRLRHQDQPTQQIVTSDMMIRLQRALEAQIVAAGAAGVTTFNSRSGFVTLLTADVTGALGYTPTSITGLTGVQSVAALKTGLALVKADVGLGSVDNTADAAKVVLSASKLTTARTINGVSFDGTGNITVPGAPPADGTYGQIIISGTGTVYTLAAGAAEANLGFTPQPAGSYLTSISSGDVTGALGYTPTSVTGLTGSQSVAAFKTGLSLVKADVGLGSVDNTADAAKAVLSATKLTTARNINGVAFDGSADITVPGVNSGTSFPGSPATNDQFYRTDRNINYFYDGTRWLSTQLHSLPFQSANTGGFTADSIVLRGPVPFKGQYDIWLERWQTSSILTATAIWLLNLVSADAANVKTTVATRSTSGDAASTWISGETTIGAQLSTSALTLEFIPDETTGTATLSAFGFLTYRLIG